MTLAIECEAVMKTYPGKPPVEAVRGIDLQVPTGECFGLLGPNGAGKTTTLEMIEGLLDPTSGRIALFGLDWRTHESAIRARIGITLQETMLSEKLKVRETVQLFRSFYASGLDPMTAIEQVSLTEKESSRVGKLSGGQKQRLAVACALVGDPEMLFLDEPTTGLDPKSRRELWEIIRNLKTRGRPVVLTTHYMDEAERLCDRVAIVDQGKILAIGSPRELIDQLGGEHLIELTLDANQHPKSEAALGTIAGISAVRRSGDSFALSTPEPHESLPRVLNYLSTNTIQLRGLSTRSATLEDVFVARTGRHLLGENPTL